MQCVLVRSDQEPVVVNLDIPVAEEPEQVEWVDPPWRRPGRTHLIAPEVTLPMNTRWNSRKMTRVGAASRNSAANRVS